jgi:two-component system invasion response regulator UvrY
MIGIGIVDDHAVIRAGLRNALSGYEDMRVVGEATNETEAFDLVCRRTDVGLNVLVLDLMTRGKGGHDVLTLVKAKLPDLAVLVVSGVPEDFYALTLIRHGARGYLNKSCALVDMVEAVRTVAVGRYYFTPAVIEILALRVERPSSLLPHEQLTPREFQVFLRLARGIDMPTICHQLSLSIDTLREHRRKLLRKMGIQSNCELTYYAVKNRLIE